MNKQNSNKIIKYTGYFVLFFITVTILLGIITNTIQERIGNLNLFVYYGLGLIIGSIIVRFTPVGKTIKNNILLYAIIAVAIMLAITIITFVSIGYSAQTALTRLSN